MLSELGERTRVFANANGSFTAETAAAVQRVKNSGGRWVKPDPTLHRDADGRIVPAATSMRISFSGGGTAAAATIGKGESELGLHWPTALPAPTLSGANATYAEVLPGVDLVLTAQAEGFSEVLVVKTAAAAANPALSAVRFRTSSTKLRLTQGAGGSLTAVDGSGATLFGSGDPVMWDSTRSGDSRPARVVTPGAARRAMPLQLSGNDLVIHPDTAMLRDKATKFPVYIDPALGRTAWTMINSKYSTQEYWSYDRSDCPDPYGSIQCAKVGYTNDPASMIYRSMFAFGISGLLHKHIQDAKLSMDTVYSWTNTDYGTQVRVTGGISAATNWSNNASTWGGVVATANSHAHDRVRRRTEWGVTSAVSTASGGTNGTLTFGLRAVDETTVNQWKKFDAGTALLTVIYNSYPNVPDTITVGGQPCTRGSGQPYVRTLTPALKARQTDPDGTARLLTGWFYWYVQGGTRTGTQTVAQSSIVSGQYATATIGAGKLVDGGKYTVQAITNDGIDYGQYSPTCEFTVDISAPGIPAGVTSSVYPNDGQFHGGVGTPGSFTLLPPATVPTDFAGYAWTLDAGVSAAAANQVAATNTSPSATITITPTADQAYNLRVWSKDKAGNYSAEYIYKFSVRAGTGPDARWTFDASNGTDDSTHGNTLTPTGTWTAGRGGYGSALQLNGTSQSAATGGPIATRDPSTGAAITLHTNGSYTVAATVRLDSLTGSGQRVVVAQNGTNTAAYQLSYSVADQKWRFAVAQTDAAAPTTVAILSNAAATTGTWTRLFATYDGTSHALRLFVNGVQQTATGTSTTFDATGAVTVGRVTAGSYFPGAIDDVRIYGRVVGTAEHEFDLIGYPNPPLLTFASTSTYAGRNLDGVISAGGDTAVTQVKYQLGTGTPTTVTLPAAGGQTTVSVTSTALEKPSFYAWGIDSAGRVSPAATVALEFTAPPALTGKVTDGRTSSPRSGITVLLTPGDLTQVTNATGDYSFTGIEAGSYTVSAVYGGSGCASQTAGTDVNVDTAVVRNLALNPATADRFGYQCDLAAGTAFVAGTTKIGLTGDNEVSDAITLPFSMPYYGTSYDQAWVSTNGVMSFKDPGGWMNYDPVSLPARDFAPVAALMPFWCDLALDDSSGVFTKVTGTGAAQRFVIEWRNVYFYWEDPAEATRFSFEVVLAPNGDISFNYSGLYDDWSKGLAAAVGVTSPGGAYAVQDVFESPDLADGTAVTFNYPQDAWPIPTYTISGTILYDGQPAPGTYLYLEGHEKWTDESGYYELPEVEEATYSLWALGGCARGGEPNLVVDNYLTENLTLQLPGVDDWNPTCAPSTTAWIPGETPISPSGDDPVTVPIGFNFPFYGRNVASVGVMDYGQLQFTTAVDGPDIGWGGGTWVWPASYVRLDGQSQVLTKSAGTAPNRKFVVEWRNVYLEEHPGVRCTFEVILGEDGTQTVVFKDLPDAAATGNHIEFWIWGPDGQGVNYYESVMRALRNGNSVTIYPPVAG
ncbi:hypothetical protein BJ973_008007 [Actinoplanes tereljensis]|uniref:LamG-like jellyroll fold domain-containing protein n=1 Tax=Paractinoplanes tereljensis TaxID=571912 RepID=A0A919TV90_9ACTN|nr:LamG-like jellyroll fold domain-containing protein [Actinoplanes tereljensis]GIF24528.1 hypothetical protein Ate02nite_72580 [Actinoplanes tereljensis]